MNVESTPPRAWALEMRSVGGEVFMFVVERALETPLLTPVHEASGVGPHTGLQRSQRGFLNLGVGLGIEW